MPVTYQDIDKALSAIEQFQRKRKTQQLISDAQKRGDKISYKIDPTTGVAIPMIEPADPYQDLVREAIQGGQLELSGTGPQGARFGKPTETPQEKKKKKAKQDILDILTKRDQLITQTGGLVEIPSVAGGKIDIDLNKREELERGIDIYYGDEWKEDPEITAALDISFPKVDKKIKKEEAPKKSTIQQGFEASLEALKLSPDVLRKIKDLLTPKQQPTKKQYKPGDTKVFGGITYTRDAEGSWHPSQK